MVPDFFSYNLLTMFMDILYALQKIFVYDSGAWRNSENIYVAVSNSLSVTPIWLTGLKTFAII